MQLCLDNAINRANFHALACVKITFTFYAQFGIDFINFITLENCFDWAFWFTSTTGDAFLCNFHCHDLFPPKINVSFTRKFIPFENTRVNRRKSYFNPDNQRAIYDKTRRAIDLKTCFLGGSSILNCVWLISIGFRGVPRVVLGLC
jgi:hypothetical protein